MSILPGMEIFNHRDERVDDLGGMISNLIELANANYLKYLAAAAIHNEQEVWDRFHESLALEHDIDALTILYGVMGPASLRQMPQQ